MCYEIVDGESLEEDSNGPKAVLEKPPHELPTARGCVHLRQVSTERHLCSSRKAFKAFMVR